MKLLEVIKFALMYNIERNYIVYDFKNQMFCSFLHYKDAKDFSDSQFMYRPKVLVEIRKKKK